MYVYRKTLHIYGAIIQQGNCPSRKSYNVNTHKNYNISEPYFFTILYRALVINILYQLIYISIKST